MPSLKVKSKIMLRLLCCLLCGFMLLQSLSVLSPVTAAVTVPTHESLYSQISTVYQRSLDYDKTYYGSTACYGYSAFTSLCAHYVHIQLMLLGINTRYVGGNGKDEYDNYKNLNYSGGGRRIHAYPSSKWSIYDALADISRQSRISTGILCGFEYTSTTAGKKYGHVMLIHGMIDGNVYFTDNFATKFGDKSYAAGEPIVCTVSEFAAFYGRPSVFGFDGIIWFEDEPLTAAVGGKELASDNTSDTGTSSVTSSLTPGEYTVTYAGGLRIRKSYTTASATLEIIPGNSTVVVTEIKNNWGRVYTNVSGTYYDGWINLDYTKRIGDLPGIAAEKYKNGSIISREWFNTLPEALTDAASSDKYVLYANTTLTEDITLGSGKTLETGSYTVSASAKARLLIRGGKVVSKIKQSAAAADPFVSASYSSSTYTYVCNSSVSLSEAGLSVTNGASVRLIGTLTVPSGIQNLSYTLVSSDFSGKKEFTKTSLSGSRLELVTSALPADTLGDKVRLSVRVSATSYGKTYTIDSDEIQFCPSEYVSSIYGKDSKLDSLLADLMNFASSVQAMNGAASDEYVNKVLPESARSISYDNSLMQEAIDAPVTNDTCKVNIESVTLSLDGGAALNFRVDGSTAGTKLMVFSYSAYQSLLEKYGSANVGKHMTEENADEILTADSDGNFVFSSPTAKQFADTYYFRICRTASGITTYDSAFAYSITEYCRRAVTVTDDKNIINLCRSLCALSASARNYFGYNINNE